MRDNHEPDGQGVRDISCADTREGLSLEDMAKDKKRVGGPSGSHKNPRRQITATAENFQTMDKAAKDAGFKDWASWALSKLMRSARAQLGIKKS